jgi:hypothetical protein
MLAVAAPILASGVLGVSLVESGEPCEAGGAEAVPVDGRALAVEGGG